MKKIPMLLILVLMLGACSSGDGQSSNSGAVNDGEASNEYGAIDHGVDEKKIGFSLSGDTIEEAANVPAAEKEQILEAFDVYIETFNEKDIDRYIDMLSNHWDKAEEREYMTVEVFEKYDVARKASEVTVVKYSDTEAQVFAKLKTSLKQLESGLEISPSGRQVTVLTKEDGKWKVGPIHFIGEDAK